MSLKLFFKYVMVFLLIAGGICPGIQASNEVVLNQDLEYINSDLRDVIRDLAEIGSYRVILDRQVQGEVSLTLIHGVTAKEAISTVARGYGYSSRWINASALMVGTSAYINGNFAARSTRIHTLANADPVLVAEKLQTIIPRERIKIDHVTRELTVTADIAEHQNISELVNRLDHSNSSINLEIRVEELNDSLLKELQLETDWRTTELGAVVLNAQQQTLLQGNANHILIGKSSLTCFNNQEARVLIGDYLPKLAQPNNGGADKLSAADIESGTRMILAPSITYGSRLNLRINTSVKTIADHKQNVVRGIHSLIGMNLNETVLFNGVMQKNEYLNLKKTTIDYQYPILESMFEKSNAKDSGRPTRIILLITPRLADGSEKNITNEIPESLPGANEQNNAIENSQGDTLPSPGNSTPNQIEVPTPEESTKLQENKPVVIFDAVVVPEKQLEKTQSSGQGTAELYDVKYTVKKGDTPTSIAKKYGMELSAILETNGLSNTDVIKVGSVLVIAAPADRIYIVKPKETLWRISKRYGLAIEVLMDLNGIEDQTKVKEGQALVLPMSNQSIVNPQF